MILKSFSLVDSPQTMCNNILNMSDSLLKPLHSRCPFFFSRKSWILILFLFSQFFTCSGTNCLSPISPFTIIEWDPESGENVLVVPDCAIVRVKTKSPAALHSGIQDLTSRSGDWTSVQNTELKQEMNGPWKAEVPAEHNVFTLDFGNGNWLKRNIFILRSDNAVHFTPFVRKIPYYNKLHAGGIRGLSPWRLRSEDPAKDAGCGKYSYLSQRARYLKSRYNTYGMECRPFYAAMPWDEHSPYMTPTTKALNDDWYIDWLDERTVPESSGYKGPYYGFSNHLVNYTIQRQRENAAARYCFDQFKKEAKASDSQRWREFLDFKDKGIVLLKSGKRIANIKIPQGIFSYAKYRAFNEILGNSRNEWMKIAYQDQYKDPLNHPEVKKRKSDYEDFVLFYQYKQWIAFQQFFNAQDEINELDMVSILDVPFGELEEGVSFWENPGAFLKGKFIGMPGENGAPDQNWGFVQRNFWNGGYEDFLNKFDYTVDVLQASGIRADAIHRIFDWVKQIRPNDYDRFGEMEAPGERLLNDLTALLDHYNVIKIAENPGPSPKIFEEMGFGARGWLIYDLRAYDWVTVPSHDYVQHNYITACGTHDTVKPLTSKGGTDAYIGFLKWQYTQEFNGTPMTNEGDERGERDNDPAGDPRYQWTERNRIPGDPGYNPDEFRRIDETLHTFAETRAQVLNVPFGISPSPSILPFPPVNGLTPKQCLLTAA